jgi:dTDP-4-dehydrorhamnose reductase
MHWKSLVREIAPQAIVHTAALAGIDFCEANQAVCTAVNTQFTVELAAVAAELGTKFVYCSTDNVFDGERGPYGEEDPAHPVNHYGHSKRAGELAVENAGGSWAVARLALVMGLPIFGTGNAFLARMLPTLDRGEVLGVPPKEIRSPIDVVTLGRVLLELAENDFNGYLHLAGDDILPRDDIARRIAVRFGFPAELVQARDPEDLPGRAPRPRDVSLCNSRAKCVLDTPLCGIEEGLDRILSRL